MSEPAYTASEVLSVEIADHAATVWLDRPDKLNAMNRQFWDDFPVIMSELAEDESVRAVVIAGKGPAFSVGIDLEMFGELDLIGGGAVTSPAAQNTRLYRVIKRMQDTMTAAERCPKPVIAAIHGYCLGGAVDLVTACDIRLAAADAVFSVRETKLGMVADVGTVQRLPRVIGRGAANELLYTGRDIDADRALAIGLVNDVVPTPEALHEAAADLAREIAANSPLVTQGLKRVMAAGEGRSIDEALDYMAVWNAAFIRSSDFAEGVAAQMQRRPPEFTGE
jgi:enoyl-CoA hydratase